MLGGPPLGFKPNKHYQEKKVKTRIQQCLDTLFRWDHRSGKRLDEIYDYHCFETIFHLHIHLLASEIKKNLLDDLKTFCQGQPNNDDVTLVEAHRQCMVYLICFLQNMSCRLDLYVITLFQPTASP